MYMYIYCTCTPTVQWVSSIHLQHSGQWLFMYSTVLLMYSTVGSGYSCTVQYYSCTAQYYSCTAQWAVAVHVQYSRQWISSTER